MNVSNGEEREHVLVTGGAGYVGSVLVPLLLEEGYEVTVLDIFNFGVSSLLSCAANDRLHLVKGDIRNIQILRKASSSADAIIHLAALVGYPACEENTQLAEAVNAEGTRNVISCLQPRQKLIYSSTGSCYGVVDGLCDENTKVSPLTIYGHTKAVGEQLVLDYGGLSLRLATLFGISPRMRLDLLVNTLVKDAIINEELSLYQPSYRRTFLHVRDAAKAFILALKRYDDMRGQVFNVGDTSMNMMKADVADQIKETLGDCEIRICDGEDKDQRNYSVSYHKIQKLGFQSTITLKQGIRELLEVIPKMSEAEIELSKNSKLTV